MAMSAAPVASSSSRTSCRCRRGMTSVWPGWNCRKSMAANARSFSQTMLAGAAPCAMAQKTHPSAMESAPRSFRGVRFCLKWAAKRIRLCEKRIL
jgi:hypothetical protein